MRPVRNRTDRLTQFTLDSDIYSTQQLAHHTFDAETSVARNMIENHAQNISATRASSFVPNTTVQRSHSLMQHIVNKPSHSRPDITGTQRMTIYFSDKDPKSLAENHHCDLASIYRIQSNPLSSFGLTFRQFKVFLCDILDEGMMNYYSNVSRVPVVLPDLPGSKRPGSKSALTPFHQSLIRSILVHKSELYLDQILGFLVFIEPSLTSSISAVSRTLKKMGFSSKVPNRVLSRADNTESIFFKNLFDIITFYSFQLVFLDETSNSRKLGIHLRGWAPRGKTPLSRSRNTGKRYSFIGSININGFLYSELIPGSLNAVTFQRILNQNVFPLMNPYPLNNSVLILDNCRAHDISIQDIFDQYGIVILFLPPYSPFLNPIERLFSAMKAKIKRLIFDKASLRNNPVQLWLESYQFCSNNFDFKKVIESTYVPHEVNQRISVRI